MRTFREVEGPLRPSVDDEPVRRSSNVLSLAAPSEGKVSRTPTVAYVGRGPSTPHADSLRESARSAQDDTTGVFAQRATSLRMTKLHLN